MPDIKTDNILVMNQGHSPLVGFNYMLRVEAIYDLPCKSIRSFTRELEYDIIQEGGLNDYVHMRRKQITKPFTLEIERYVGVDYLDPMPLGADLLLPVVLLVSRYPGYFTPFKVARTYTFTGCSVIKKTYGELVGDSSALLVETTTLAYREMVLVDIPWSQSKQGASKDNSEQVRKKNETSALERLKIDIKTLVDNTTKSYYAAHKQMTGLDELVTKLKDEQKRLDTISGNFKKNQNLWYSAVSKAKGEVERLDKERLAALAAISSAKANKDKLAAEQKKLEEENKAKLAAAQKKLDEEDKAKLTEAQKKLEEENKAKLAAEQKKLDEENKAKLAAEQKKLDEENKAKLTEAQKKLDEANKAFKAASEQARTAEAIAADLLIVQEELKKALPLAEARVKDAREADTTATTAYNKAKPVPSNIASMTELKTAQPVAQQARVDCRQCTNQCNIVERTHEFLSGKLEKATSLRLRASALKLPESPKPAPAPAPNPGAQS